MPLNVRRSSTAVFAFFLVSSVFVVFAAAQAVPPANTTAAMTPQPVAPTSGDVMRERISKSKAFIAVRNYNAAIYELENIRKETNDAAVHGVVNVLLMNSYLEQGDYKRAQALLTEFYNGQKANKPNASASYMAVAGQIIKGARTRAERYQALGLSVSDRTLPLEATNDLEKMRETLEIVIAQSKEIGANKTKAADALMLLEEASSSRGMLARDDYDSRRWKNEVADTREQVAGSRSVVISAINDGTTDPSGPNLVAENTKPMLAPPSIIPVVEKQVVEKPEVPLTSPTREREVKIGENRPMETAETATAESKSAETTSTPIPAPLEKTVAQIEKPIIVVSSPQPSVREPAKSAEPVMTPAKKDPVTSPPQNNGPVDVGSLIGYATRQAPPIYPAVAKSVRATGLVKVEVTIDESGDVSEIQKTSGHQMLQGAARDAIRKWKFKPFLRDGQPVKATGFVNFNFNL